MKPFPSSSARALFSIAEDFYHQEHFVFSPYDAELLIAAANYIDRLRKENLHLRSKLRKSGRKTTAKKHDLGA